MTYCSRRTVTNVRSSSQSSLKLSAISTIAYWLPDAARETLANEAAALCLKTALPFTCTLTVNGSTVAGFEQSAFARSVIAFFNENAAAVSMEDNPIRASPDSKDQDGIAATIHFKPLLPEVSDALLNGPQLESLHLHFKLSDHRGPTDAAANSSEPICPLSELIQQQPLSLNILCLLERALEKAVAGWSRRMPLVVNAELKENVPALLSRAHSISASMKAILDSDPAYQMAYEALHSLRNVPLTRPEKRRRIERDDSDTSDSDGSSDASGSPASESEEDTSQTSICSAVFQMAMQGIKPAAPKLRRTLVRKGTEDDDDLVASEGDW